jgi:NADH dehydrogenase
MIDNSPRHIVIVGGGAAGLELATKLGDSLGRRKTALEYRMPERSLAQAQPAL